MADGIGHKGKEKIPQEKHVGKQPRSDQPSAEQEKAEAAGNDQPLMQR
jgi:hypothetical protein